MKTIQIENSPNTPHVSLDLTTGKILFEGRCYPVDPSKFFNPLIKWLEQYCEDPSEETCCRISLEYFNTSSSIQLMRVLYQLEGLHQSGSKVCVKWYYEKGDDDSRLAGQDYLGLLDLPFELIEKDRPECRKSA